MLEWSGHGTEELLTLLMQGFRMFGRGDITLKRL